MVLELGAPTSEIRVGGWHISLRRTRISNAGELAAAEARLGLTCPEMYFGLNYVQLRHGASGALVRFGAEEALAAVGDFDPSVQVIHAETWRRKR